MTLNSSPWVVLLLILMAGGATAFGQQPGDDSLAASPRSVTSPFVQADSVKITLERTSCYGECPAYTVVVSGDGLVAYEGLDWVGAVGERRRQISPDSVAQLNREIWASDFLTIDPSRYLIAQDVPVTTVSVTVGATIKKVVGVDSEIPTLRFIAQRIDEITMTEEWTGAKARERLYDSLRHVRESRPRR